MKDNLENLSALKKPLRKRLSGLLFSYSVSLVIGVCSAIIYILAYSIQYYGVEQMAWGISQALMPESEVKQELARLQGELHHANGKIADITKAIASARKLGPGGPGTISEGRARLANPNAAAETESVKNKGFKKMALAPAQGGGEDETDSLLDSLLFRLRGVQPNPIQIESRNFAPIFESTPMGVPVSGELTSDFGFRTSPFSGFRQAHKGIDVAMKRGTELYATADGIVEVSGWGGAYGNNIIIDHGVGTDGARFETLYAHLSKIYVKAGVAIRRGERIGQVGTTGHSTGPHVHYEVRKNGVAVNPEPFVELAGLLD
jgi:murein DD-endopeptidase MepM/ murein hydrolase activator NlpD